MRSAPRAERGAAPPGAGVVCPGCGARVSGAAGPGHAYIGAAPGCWQVYARLLAALYGDGPLTGDAALAVDAYAAQHPGVPSRPAIRSVAVHLIALHWVLERGLEPARLVAVRRRYLDHPELSWLEPPADAGERTVHDVVDLDEPGARERACRRWAESVWRAWSPHHATLRHWASRHGGERFD